MALRETVKEISPKAFLEGAHRIPRNVELSVQLDGQKWTFIRLTETAIHDVFLARNEHRELCVLRASKRHLPPDVQARLQRGIVLNEQVRHQGVHHLNQVTLLKEGGKNQTVSLQPFRGRSIHEHLKDPPGRQTDLGVEVGIAMGETLEKSTKLGVVHRDLKPGNICKDQEGRIFLTDPDTWAPKEIARREIAGTPPYMEAALLTGTSSPEHMGLTDLHALGLTLQAILRGKEPQDPRIESYEPPRPEDVIWEIAARINNLFPKGHRPVAHQLLDASALLAHAELEQRKAGLAALPNLSDLTRLKTNAVQVGWTRELASAK